MKIFTVIFLLGFAALKIVAQSYQISFAGTGAVTTVTSVHVENMTACWQIPSVDISGNDILQLGGTVGINNWNTDADNNIIIYPNPMEGTCSIDFDATAQGKTMIEIYDITGKRILHVQELLSKGRHTYSLSGICSGIYILKIKSDKYSYTGKITCSNLSAGKAEIKHIGMTSSIIKQNTHSDAAKSKGMDGSKSIIVMPYGQGDRLKLTGKSGVYQTVIVLVPTLSQTVTFNFVACTDDDNNNYSTVQIGSQTWMAENLKTTKYLTGDAIPDITDMTAWTELTSGGRCTYKNTTNTDTINTFGRLYNWYAVNDIRNIAPSGWHVPTDAEWNTLTDYLGGLSEAGGKLKEACLIHWLSPNQSGSNETGFTALPGGDRESWGPFLNFLNRGHWWSATYNYGGSYRTLDYNNGQVGWGSVDRKFGYSVRCLKD